MKNAIARFPEVFGLLLGLLDAVPRYWAAQAFAPGKAQLHGWLLVGNVHHVSGPQALGLHTMQWFGIAAGLLLMFYVSLQVTAYLLRPVNTGFLVARGALGAVAGVLLLNVAESATTGKVTDYIGWAFGTRFTAINFGDVLVTVAVIGFAVAFASGIALRLLPSAARA